MKLILKGFIIGIGKIIPGVSGALLAITLGVYEKAVKSIGTFFKDPINNFKFLFPLGIGVVLSIPLTSKFILYLLDNFYIQVMLLFIGLITGGIIPMFSKINIKNIKISNYIVMFLSFIFVLSLSFIGDNLFLYEVNNSLLKSLIYLLIGFIDAATMIIPGISGTAVMMLLGLYDMLLNLLSSLNNINSIINNLNLIIPYIIGIILTIIILSKMMSYLFENKSDTIYSSIIGFSISSVLILFIDLFKYNIKIYYFIFLILGLVISYKLEKK